jgi:hypothetical protein
VHRTLKIPTIPRARQIKRPLARLSHGHIDTHVINVPRGEERDMKTGTNELRVGEAAHDPRAPNNVLPAAVRKDSCRKIHLKRRIAAFPPHSNQFQGSPVQFCASVATPFRKSPRSAEHRSARTSVEIASDAFSGFVPIPANSRKTPPFKTKNYQTNPSCHHELSYNHNGLSQPVQNHSEKRTHFQKDIPESYRTQIPKTSPRTSSFCLLPSSFFLLHWILCPVVPNRPKSPSNFYLFCLPRGKPGMFSSKSVVDFELLIIFKSDNL